MIDTESYLSNLKKRDEDEKPPPNIHTIKNISGVTRPSVIGEINETALQINKNIEDLHFRMQNSVKENNEDLI